MQFATIMQSRLNVYILHAIQRIFSKLFGQLLVYLLNKRAIGQQVGQFNAKFRLTVNWTLLRLFDFMIIAQIIVKLIIDLTNTCVVNMLVMKNTA